MKQEGEISLNYVLFLNVVVGRGGYSFFFFF